MVSRTRVAYVQGAASSKKRGNQQVHEDVLAACTLQFSNTESLTGLSISLRWIPARGTGKQLVLYNAISRPVECVTVVIPDGIYLD